MYSTIYFALLDSLLYHKQLKALMQFLELSFIGSEVGRISNNVTKIPFSNLQNLESDRIPLVMTVLC